MGEKFNYLIRMHRFMCFSSKNIFIILSDNHELQILFDTFFPGVFASKCKYMNVYGGKWVYRGDGAAPALAGELIPSELYHPRKYENDIRIWTYLLKWSGTR